MNLKDKVVVITGVSTGLGAACARTLISKGAKVFGIARNKERLYKLRKELGEQFTSAPLDITDEKAISQWARSVFSAKLCPSVLINNAGVGGFGAVDKISTNEWQSMIETNLSGMFFTTRNIVPFMRMTESARHIINIGSVLGKTTRTEASAYCASKFGVQGFSEALAKELRWAGIKVTCINPGSIATGFFRQSGIEPHANMLQPSDLSNLIAFVLETPENFLIDEITVRPLNPSLPGI